VRGDDSERPRILVADDQADVRHALRVLLKGQGMAVEPVDSPAAAEKAVGHASYDAALIDLNYSRDTTSGREGMELLTRLSRLDPDLPVVVMTAWGTIDLAVEAMQAGASDFIEKPWENARLVSVIRNQVELARARRREALLARENELLRAADEDEIVAESPAMRKVLSMARRVADSEAAVLILGENGAGKGLLAEFIHRNSPRCDEPLVKVNMGGIAESVFESEMFGHVKGAFTGATADRIGRLELAGRGTLFLDEIANLPPSQQPKLLRVLEDREFERLGSSRSRPLHARILSATNADIAAETAADRFRKDLLFRLNTVELRLPALRDRREDIRPLSRLFLQRSARKYGRQGMRFSESALQALERHVWPGNVRELDHVIERAVLLADSGELDAELLDLREPPPERLAQPPAAGADTLEEVESGVIRSTMAECDGNVQRAAEKLGLSRQALYRRLEKYGLRSD
jgi:DNA-binding NtrC family response regulator